MDLPEIPLESFEVPVLNDASEMGIKNEYQGSLDYGVIGVGQAGCRIAKSFYDKGYKKCLAINTAVGDLNPLDLPVNQKLKIGSFDGSGKNMALGQAAVAEDSQRVYDTIKKLLGNVDKVVLSFGVGGGCFTADTKISLVDGTERTIPEIEALLSAGEHVEVYSYNKALKRIENKKVVFAGKTKLDQMLLRVTLDNGEHVDCTEDHPFMRRDGSYVEAQHLKAGDSLMPLYRRLESIDVKQPDTKNYRQVYNPEMDRWHFEHRIFAEGRGKRGWLVHHKNFKKEDNRSVNLQRMTGKDHSILHSVFSTDRLIAYNKSAKGRATSGRIISKFNNSDEGKARRVEHNRSVKMRQSVSVRVRDAQGYGTRIAYNKSDIGRARSSVNGKLMNTKNALTLVNTCFMTYGIVNEHVWCDYRAALKRAGNKYPWTFASAMRHLPASRDIIAVNHRVTSVEKLAHREDVFDITVEDNHNFALSSGVFVHNSGSGSCITMVELLTKYLKTIGRSSIDIVMIVALPTVGELQSPVIKKNMHKILGTLSSLIKDSRVGPIILMDNAKIEKLYKGIPPTKFWGTINDTIAGLFHTFNMVSDMESKYSTFDTEDYRTVLGVSGLAVLGVTRVSDSGGGLELSQALQDNMKKTLLCDKVAYTSAKQAACIVVADKVTMEGTPMDVFNYGFDTVSNLVPSADVHRGLLDSDNPGVRAFTLITGVIPDAAWSKVPYID